jgi:hypothetical protein
MGWENGGGGGRWENLELSVYRAIYTKDKHDVGAGSAQLFEVMT